jgi:transposase InsO family protein
MIRIQKIYQEHKGRYGVPRVQATLQREGTRCSAKRLNAPDGCTGTVRQDQAEICRHHR